ncbi:MAG: DUF3168 domain-containing protein [Gammaproteobacteria bacterium]|nr:DUF3168 domain-containing protein [Gammaproteobacteria bacterium]
MSVGTDLFTRLTTDVAVNAIVSLRVYPGKFKQQGILPAVRYNRLSSVNYLTMSVDTGIEKIRYQIDALAPTYAEADELRDAIKATLRRWKKAGIQDTFFISESDIFDDETRLYRVRMDFDIVTEV